MWVARVIVVSTVLVCVETSNVASLAAATTKTYLGTLGNLWSNSANWNPAGAPLNGDSVVLPSGSNSTDDIPGLVIKDVTATGPVFAGAANPLVLTIDGDVHTLADPVLAGGLQLNSPHLSSAVHHLVVDQGSGLDMGPSLSGDGDIVKSGLGSVGLSGSFTGNIDVLAGEVSGDLGQPTGKTTLRAGTLAVPQLGNPGEPFEIWPGSSGSPTTMITSGPRSGPLTTMGAGEFTVTNSWGNITSLISGPGHVTLAHATSAGELTIAGANTYSGGTSLVDGGFHVSGASPLGTGPVTLDGPGLLGARLYVEPGTTLHNGITVNGGDFWVSDDGVAAAPVLSGDLTFNSVVDHVLEPR